MVPLFSWLDLGGFIHDFWQEGVGIGVLTFVGICIWKTGYCVGRIAQDAMTKLFGDGGYVEILVASHLDFVSESKVVQKQSLEVQRGVVGQIKDLRAEEVHANERIRIAGLHACTIIKEACTKFGLSDESFEALEKIQEALSSGDC